MDISRTDIQGLILAGGKSSRFNTAQQGIDKGLLPIDGKPLIAHVADFMAANHIQDIYISANRNTSQYQPYGTVLPDLYDIHYAGPLAGIYTALTHTEKPWLWVLPVDMLFLPTDLLDKLAALIAPEQPVYAVNNGISHPLCLLLYANFKDSLGNYLAAGGRKVHQWLNQQQAETVDFPGVGLFKNINSMADL